MEKKSCYNCLNRVQGECVKAGEFVHGEVLGEYIDRDVDLNPSDNWGDEIDDAWEERFEGEIFEKILSYLGKSGEMGDLADSPAKMSFEELRDGIRGIFYSYGEQVASRVQQSCEWMLREDPGDILGDFGSSAGVKCSDEFWCCYWR